MLITTLEAMNFKNIGEARLDFSEGVNCFVGRNGMGKSNLLEASCRSISDASRSWP